MSRQLVPASVVSSDQALAARCAALEARVAALEAAEQQRQQRQRVAGLRRGDAAFLVRLIPALRSLMGSEEFLARDLVDSEHPLVVRLVAGRSKKTLGRLLARAEGVAIGEYAIAGCGRELGVKKYRIEGF
jgi:BMFP domain-containing protein YqiC